MKLFLILILLSSAVVFIAAEDEILLHQNFEEIEIGGAPSEFLILEGEFTVQEHDGGKVLYLPGTPLSDYGVLFGPAAAEGLQISAKIKSEKTRRLFPRIGVGLGGVNGYKLYIVPNRRVLEISQNKETKVEVPFQWKTGEWAYFRLQIRKENDQWIIEGKVWQEGKEPNEWMITYQTQDQPTSGKPSVWGTPFSSQPIYFDDIKVTRPS